VPSQPFSRERFEARRRELGTSLGAPLVLHAVTASTNDDALTAARQDAPHGTTFVAEHQTQGRGRRGRGWFAAEGESLLCSVLLRIPLPLEAVSALSLAAGLAVREAVAAQLPAHQERGLIGVKWPNDIWVEKKKIAGVLAESQVRGGLLDAAVVGFGVNVMTAVFPDELQRSATSLAQLGIAAPVREVLLADVLQALEERTKRLLTGGVGALSLELARNDALLGHKIRVDEQEGTAAGIDDQGRLLLCLTSKQIVAVSAGTVELVD
jgi:BirA family biotin operon repressor/biotin-[acetyl-CoA-carboxylase] ligase